MNRKNKENGKRQMNDQQTGNYHHTQQEHGRLRFGHGKCAATLQGNAQHLIFCITAMEQPPQSPTFCF